MKAFYRLLYYVSILLTCLLAGITLVGAFPGTVSPDNSADFAFIGLVLPILLFVNLAAAIYWLIRWRCWVLIPLVAIVGNWGYLNRIFQHPLLDSAALPKVNIQVYNQGTLTVATYNVGSFNREQTGYSAKQIASTMKDLYVDVLCFQEFGINKEFTLDSLKVVFDKWPYSYVPASPEGKSLLQLAVFSRYPIKEQNLITYPESNNCSLWCDIDFNGRTIRLFNNHLQTTEVTRNRSKLQKELKTEDVERTEYALRNMTVALKDNFRKRDKQAVLVNEIIAASPHPALVCGDFNSTPSSYTYHKMKGDKLEDGFQTCGHGYMYTFRLFKHLLRIDYILHSKEFKGVDYFSPDIDYSDHNPVVMRMKL